MKKRRLLGMVSQFAFLAIVVNTSATTRTWTGGGADTLASTPGNWLDGLAPETGDSVLFDATSSQDCTWDLDIAIENWTQTTDYGGTVTFLTVYSGHGPFTNLTITGNAVVLGGAWTHLENSGDHDAVDRLSVSVGGNFTLGSGATLDLYGRGFANGRGPGNAGTGQRGTSRAVGASHGGVGGHGDDTTPIATYGCPFRPESLGSSGDRRGGGNLNLVVTGTATIDGVIDADGDSRSSSQYRPGTGGSILVQAGAFAGSGTITARGNSGYRSSGGGRIALVSTVSTDDPEGDFTLSARAGTGATSHGTTGGGRGTAGTLYFETPNGGRLVINAEEVESRPGLATKLIWPLATDPHPAMTDGIAADVRLELTSNAVVRLFADWRMAELDIEAGSTLYLHGYTLYLTDDDPGGGFPDLSQPSTDPVDHAALGGGTLEPEGGRLFWEDAAPTFRIPISTGGPEGSIDNYDAETYYAYDTPLTVTANPAADHAFVRWIGTLPETADPEAEELTLTVKPELHLRALFASTAANTYTWIGGEGSDQKASSATNWYPEGVPQNGDHIVMSGAAWSEPLWDATPLHRDNEYRDNYDRLADWMAHSSAIGWWHGTRFRSPYHIEDEDRYISPAGLHGIDIEWDLEIEPASWTQTEWFSGWVTFPIRYPDAGGYTNLVIDGNLTIDGGYWTHKANTGGDDATERLAVSVGGDFSMGEWGRIELHARGFAAGSGPGAGVNGFRSGKGGSHGGQGARHGNQDPSPCYGSVTRPDALGSGAHGRGGGALWLNAGGAATLDGVIRADGEGLVIERPGGAGGSVFLQAATVTGNGTLMAPGGWGYYTGGGGRVAVVAKNGATLGDVDLLAPAGHPPIQARGSVGTVFRKTIFNGETNAVLLIDQRNFSPQSVPTNLVTEIPPSFEEFETHPVVGGELEDVTLVITNGGLASLTTSLRMGDFTWIGPGSELDLDGHLLYLKANEPEPLGTFPANQGGGTILYKGGDIFWGDASAQVLLLVEAGPNGDVTRDPPSVDDMHDFESTVEVTALPDPGYDFVYWEGDVPPDQDRTNAVINVFMDEGKWLRAIFASADPATRSWIGDGEDEWASNPLNWYPNSVPTSGTHIVINANTDKALRWDLDIELGSWTQTEAYVTDYDPVTVTHFGRVFIYTKYPGQGIITNLTVTGDINILGGTWQQGEPFNSGGDIPVDRLSVSAGGNFTLAEGTFIDGHGRGFNTSSRGPGAGTSSQRNFNTAVGCSHGGMGGYGIDSPGPSSTYGSALRPETMGSSGSRRGGADFNLIVGGLATIDGLIDMDGISTSSQEHVAGSGGSVWIRAAAFAGESEIFARGNRGSRASGGGRIALYATQPDAFGDMTVSARGGDYAHHIDTPDGNRARATAGTIYYDSPAGRRLLIDAEDVVAMTNIFTDLPAQLEADAPEDYFDVQLELRRRAIVRLMADGIRIRDLIWIDADSRLYLNGHTLYVRTPYHPFTDGEEDEVVIKDGGKIVWQPHGSIIKLR